MHELALARDIVDTISEKITEDLQKIANINIEVGAFSGVVPESLEFGINTILADKNVPDVNITIVKVPTIACCTCGEEYRLTEIFETCPVCRSFERKIISGMEVLIKSVEVSEE